MLSVKISFKSCRRNLSFSESYYFCRSSIAFILADGNAADDFLRLTYSERNPGHFGKIEFLLLQSYVSFFNRNRFAESGVALQSTEIIIDPNRSDLP